MNLKTFKRGIHPAYYKELTSHKRIERAPLPKRVTIPLQQHIGAPCNSLVKKGTIVEEGQVIGEAVSFVSAPVHATIAGKVKDVGSYPNPGGGKSLAVVIDGDGTEKEWPETEVGLDLDGYAPHDIREAIKEAGIVGMGGAGFPTHVKLSPPKDTKIDTVILNGCECEPFLTSDHRVMLEATEKILWGMKAIMKAVGATRGYIGIEDNKMDAIEAMGEAAKKIIPGVEVVALETKYPQGAEKMLIKATINLLVPVGKLPLDVGVIVNNTGTAAAIYDALKTKKPLIDRIVTLSGTGLVDPKNLLVRIGTSFRELIDYCGGIEGEGEAAVINGGPMMGIAQTNLDVPVVKGTTGITVLASDGVKSGSYESCIRCASCVDACPVDLMPYRIGDLGRMEKVDVFNTWGGLTCIECGCCSFVCPTNRPLAHWIRVGKVKVREAAKVKSEE